MSQYLQCLNPGCLYQNHAATKFCQHCGEKLLLGDRYRAVRFIGEGGFGRTFQAVDEHRLDTPCVIKQFLPQQQGSSTITKAIELFKQEAIRLRDLGKHPQIPDLLAFFEQDQRLYLIQEFIDGQDLLRELLQRGNFSEQEVRQILANLLPVLEFVHKQQVIHRDIKPENIIRQQNGSLVLIDFGVSKQLSATIMTQLGTVTGTPGYAPPEQMRAIAYPASDLYSLAVTCIRLLTGCLLQDDGIDELFDPMQMEWVWRSKVKVSDELGQILDKMLQHRVGDRYQCAADVFQEFKPQSVLKLPTIAAAPDVSNQTVTISLKSAVGVDYTLLQTLLSAEKWREADEETDRVMLKVGGREKEGWLDSESINKFSCEDLRTINQLWVQYSKGCFGFSVQKQIWIECGGQSGKSDYEVYKKFYERIGWRVKDSNSWKSYNELTFQLNAPQGHLPRYLTVVWGVGDGLFFVGSVYSSLALRLINCKI